MHSQRLTAFAYLGASAEEKVGTLENSSADFFLGLSNVVVFGGQEACEESERKKRENKKTWVGPSVRLRASAACKMG